VRRGVRRVRRGGRRGRGGRRRSHGRGGGRGGGRWVGWLPRGRRGRHWEKEGGRGAAASEWGPARRHRACGGPVAGHGRAEGGRSSVASHQRQGGGGAGRPEGASGGSVGRHPGAGGGVTWCHRCTRGRVVDGHRWTGHGAAGRWQRAVRRLAGRGPQRTRREAAGRQGAARCSAAGQGHRRLHGSAFAEGGEVVRRWCRWCELSPEPAGWRGGRDGGAGSPRQLAGQLPLRRGRSLPVHVTDDVDGRRGGGRIRPAELRRHREGVVLSWFLGQHLSRWKVPVAAWLQRSERTEGSIPPCLPAQPTLFRAEMATPHRRGGPQSWR